MSGVHVVFGTGAIGLALANELTERGVTVRAVNRSGRADAPAGVEVVGGDASDAEFAAGAVRDALVVYQCLNPPYHRWPEEFPALQNAVVHAALGSGARYVSFENVYMYGDTHGAPMTEDTPMRAHTRKGRVRQAMAEQLRDLGARGDLEVTTARASNYFGPRGGDQSPLGARVIGRAMVGKPAQVVGNPDVVHSYTYTGDAARLLAELGTRDDVVGEVFHVPNAPAQTTRAIAALIGRELGQPMKLSVAPRLLLRAMGLFNPTVRELDEMRYEFEQPFVVDGSKAEHRLGMQHTPLEDAVATTVAWFRSDSSSRASPPA